MSTVPPAPPPAPVPLPLSHVSDGPQQITIVSHSNFFYWWPVWAVGFIMAMLTWWGGYVLAVVPDDSLSAPTAKRDWKVVTTDEKGADKTETLQGVLIERKSDKYPPTPLPSDLENKDKPERPHLRIADHKMFGVVFTVVLLLVIIITNVPLRGMWSLLVILLVVLLIVIFALADLWRPLVQLLSLLDIRNTMAFYMTISTVLFVVWLITFVFFDRQIYMTFTPGQLKVSTEIGGGEKVYDAVGMTLEKQRSDLFRHWILGLGSGDLIVRTSGAQAHQFDLPNVLFIGRKTAQIEQMLKQKSVIETR